MLSETKLADRRSWPDLVLICMSSFQLTGQEAHGLVSCQNILQLIQTLNYKVPHQQLLRQCFLEIYFHVAFIFKIVSIISN